MADLEDDHRWAQAQAVLDRVDDDDVRRRQRQIRNRTLVLLAGLPVLLVVAGVLIIVLADPAPARGDENDPSLVQSVLGLLIIAAGLGIGIIGFVQMRRTRLWGGRWRAPTAMLTRQQRKGLVRQIRHKELIDQEHLLVTRDLAERVVASRWLILVWVAFIVTQSGGVIQNPSRWRLIAAMHR